jgi:hypothetical protein
MDYSPDAHPPAARLVIDCFEKEFARMHQRARDLIWATPFESFYQDVHLKKTTTSPHSIGEYLLRSNGVIEQTFGGITSSLWDDPFEWTLPETLSTPERVSEYLHEVEETRKRAFRSFSSDADLLKEISGSSGEIQTLFSLLLETLMRASDYQGRAIALLTVVSNERLTGFSM